MGRQLLLRPVSIRWTWTLPGSLRRKIRKNCLLPPRSHFREKKAAPGITPKRPIKKTVAALVFRPPLKECVGIFNRCTLAAQVANPCARYPVELCQLIARDIQRANLTSATNRPKVFMREGVSHVALFLSLNFFLNNCVSLQFLTGLHFFPA